ncbi:nickel ABC transporter permease subunit NikC [Paenibacillus sp. FSL K6-1558]|uniref:Nickel ABC transporter permease subunit NikC n=2 Tax=Paenibacillus TaxID=44249 RepID=A0ABS7KDS5_9BACL|nr:MULTISPECIES: nickel ABC transporter permease subunit NikC [Paenibacillus]MBY0202121.1 nickel ABC transporter permease subunit NikC [Paenibacillus cucumis (ex Kampfer et al. 2016)]
MMNRWRTIFRGKKIIWICATIMLLFFILALLAPWIAPHDPVKVNLLQKLKDPSAEHWLGTDHLGRDNLSRLLYGARVSIGFATMIFLSSLIIGLIVGSISGYLGGWVDNVLMRLCEGILAFPQLVLVLGIVGIFGPGLMQILLALMMVQWVHYARICRNMVVSLKERNFIAAARISGSSTWTIIRKHIIPNVQRPIVVMGTLEMGWAIMDISALSFLGLGIQPPNAEWGAMIHEGTGYIRSHPELMIYPGVAILLVVMTFNILGEALSDRYGISKK